MILHNGVVIGSDGFGYLEGDDGRRIKIPQTGRVVLEDDVEIGANSCVDRATMGETVIRRGAKLDNLVQVAHGVEIGEGSFLAAYAGVAGSTKLGKGVVLAAKSGVSGHLEIGDGVQVAAGGKAFQSQPAGARLAGSPAIDHKTWLRATKAFRELPALVRRVRALEARLAELEEPTD